MPFREADMNTLEDMKMQTITQEKEDIQDSSCCLEDISYCCLSEHKTLQIVHREEIQITKHITCLFVSSLSTTGEKKKLSLLMLCCLNASTQVPQCNINAVLDEETGSRRTEETSGDEKMQD